MISRRVVMVVLGCLFAGAVVNVLVAWAFAAWGRWPIVGPNVSPVDAWPRELGDGWPREDVLGYAYSRWGFTFVAVEGFDLEPLKRSNDLEVLYFWYSEQRVGWPLRSMWQRDGQSSPDCLTHVTWRYPAGHRCEGLAVPSVFRPDRSRSDPRFPLMILPIGFAANTVFYAGLIGLPLAVPAMRRYRRSLRVRSGLCGACGYPIGVSACCTECGATLPVTGERRAVS